MMFLGDDQRFQQFNLKLNLVSSPAEMLDKTNIYRIRFRLVITPKHGVLVFKQCKTLILRNGQVEITGEYTKNTIMLLAIKPNGPSFYNVLKIFAAHDGNIDLNRFNGYKGYIGIDVSENKTQSFVDKCIDGYESSLKPTKFDKRLYRFDDSNPLSTFKEQRINTTATEQHGIEPNDDWSSSDEGAMGGEVQNTDSPQIKLTEMTVDKLTEVNFMKVRESLPIATFRRDILASIERNRVIIISGETGSGKSTQVPQFLMEEATRNGMACRIILTQPRRIAAYTVAKRISVERGDEHGISVGHQIRLEKCRKAETNLIVKTSGYLLQRLIGTKSSDAYKNITHVILDEVHEREINTDLILIAITQVMILMSATLEADQFSEYFNNCPKINVPGRLFNVSCFYLDEVLYRTGFKTDEMKIYIEDTMHCESGQEQLLLAYNSTFNDDIIDFDLLVHVIDHIHSHTACDGSILIFLPGYHDIITLHDLLEIKFEGKENFRLFILHSCVEEENVFNPLPNGTRKIIISTNLAETSVTIDDVVYVVDVGKVKEHNYDSVTESTCLDTVDISKACTKQSSGRAGRVREGCAYRLYSIDKYEKMASYTTPDMLRMSLLEICLKAKLLADGSSIKQFLAEAIQPPSPQKVNNSIEILIKINALEPNEKITQLGSHLAHMPVNCQLGKMILYSIFLQCVDPVLTIVSALSVKSLYMLRKKKKDDCESNNEFENSNATNGFSDHQTILKTCEAWCNDLSKRSMQTIMGLRKLIMNHLKMAKYIDDDSKLNENASKWEIVKSCLVAGMCRK
ncbi:3'-5' RNA helicase YTHDC2-like [Contarinia nasturtii]|uniref:3'-5' RNA helicase YTHDC2-like n=1 Tax=Contarinia nasturtii TaxID=265458 RepID=UPI0012D3BF46|nr:3'-5' RNA helicase YTHDC2-like [Contarinia nasturtii]